MSVQKAQLPISKLVFQNPSYLEDPFPALHVIQKQGRIVYHPGLNHYLVAGWADCAKIFSDTHIFASDPAMFIDFFGGETMECMEKERHDAVRGIWAKDFRRDSLQALRQMVASVVESRLTPFLERVRAGGVVDAVSGMTRGIPTLVIAKMLDIPQEDFEQFSAWSDLMGGIAEGATDPSPRGVDVLKAGKRATRDLNAYIRRQIATRATSGGNDLITRMLSSPVSKTMHDTEVIASNTQLVFAGNETTAKLMGSTLWALAQYPDQRRALVKDRSLIPRAIEEIHRWNSVVHVGWRHVRNGGTKIAGCQLEDGDVVTCLQGAANRDPQRWDDPDTLDIMRPPQQHLGFGFGMHSCLGLNLARLEIQLWLNRLLDELPDWVVTHVDWGTNWLMRGPVRIDIQAAEL